tara:strand:- start:36 stop:185 length:150 start_codon:yes stop_codon:yes gene_type:complete
VVLIRDALEVGEGLEKVDVAVAWREDEFLELGTLGKGCEVCEVFAAIKA